MRLQVKGNIGKAFQFQVAKPFNFKLLPENLLAFTIIHGSRRPGRPGSIHHMSGCEVDVGGKGPMFKYVRNKLESEFLTGQDE